MSESVSLSNAERSRRDLSENPTAVDEIVEKIAALMKQQVPDARDIRVADPRRMSGGHSRENWTFDASWLEAGVLLVRPMVLRSDPPSSPLETERSREFAVLRALESCDVPTPRAYWLDIEGKSFDKPSVIMERLPGTCEWTVLNSSRPLPVRLELAESFVKTLAKIHGVDWRAAGLGEVLDNPGPNPAAFELGREIDRLDRIRLEPLPEMDVTAVWLRRHIPAPGGVVLVHGDYKPGNALIDDDRISAVLDWETAHLGDPMEDIGWMLMPPRRGEQQIKGHWEQEQILAAYTAFTGRDFPAATVTWWIVFSLFKLSLNNLAGLKNFVAQQTDAISQTPSWLFRAMFRLIGKSE